MDDNVKIIKRYTLITKLLNGIVTLGAIVLIVLLIQDISRLTNPNWVIWLLVIIGGTHTFEEYTWPGGFIKWINGSYFQNKDLENPLSTKSAFFTDATAGVTIMGLLFMIGTEYLWLTLGITCIFIINGAWHLTSYITSGVYSPGSISSALFNLPIGAYILYFYTAYEYVSWLELLLAYGLGLGVHIIFFTILRRNLRLESV